jgi:DNA-binding transcriptional LysR family regulator
MSKRSWRRSWLSGRPTGRVRLVVPRLAAKMVVAPRLEQFTRAYPDVVLEVTTDDSPLDFVAGRYDAGIHLGEFLARDMIAVRVSQEQRAAIVGARYFESHSKPGSPRDLTSHRCISISMGSAGPYRWEFDRGSESLTVDVHGPLVVDDMDVALRAAMDGIGLAFSLEEYVAPHLASGALVRVLEEWCPPFAGFFLYYPQPTAAARGVVSTDRHASSGRSA